MVHICYGFKKFEKSGKFRARITKSGPGIPENFGFEFFLKLHFRGGLCYKFFLKNDFNPLKNRFFAVFMFSTFLHKTERLI